jgi:hypothetical protein
MKKNKKKATSEVSPKVNPDLKGFDIRINSFGEIVSSYDIDKLNEFLNKNVDDKKLRHRNDTKSDNTSEEE